MVALPEIPPVFLVLFGIQLTYQVSQLFAILSYRRPSASNKMSISVIVCAWNEYENLKRLVPKLLKMKKDDHEIIIVDDKSSDETYEYLLGMRDHLKHVRIDTTPDHINSKKYAITLGVKAAKNDWVLLTDADCDPNEAWIDEMSKQGSEKVDFVIGASQYKRGKSFLSRFIRYENLMTIISYTAMAIMGKPYMGVGRNLMYRKSVFLENKGFNDLKGVLGGDDDLLVNRLAKSKRTRVSLSKESMVYTKPKASWRAYKDQKTRHLAVGVHYRLLDKVLLSLQSLSQILIWVSFATLALSAQLDIVVIAAGLMLQRWITMMISMSVTSRKTGDRFVVIFTPIYDMLYSVYYVVMGLSALLTKRVKWN